MLTKITRCPPCQGERAREGGRGGREGREGGREGEMQHLGIIHAGPNLT